MSTRNGLSIALLLIGIAALFAGIDWYQHRFVRSDSDLLNLLPSGDATVFYARIDVLRRAGMLSLVRNSTGPVDSDYEAFDRKTDFNDVEDLDAVAGSNTRQGTFLAVRGRFNWDRIRNYVQQHGGSCRADTCQLRGSSPGKWISTVLIQRDVLGIALASSPSLATQVHPGSAPIGGPLPTAPVWVRLAPSLVKDPSSLPAALRIFLISLQPADSVLIALGPPPGGDQAFEIDLTARCVSSVAAGTVKRQLEIQTRMLKLELAREHQQPNPADLTGLLTAGTFDTSESDVRGRWPVSKELLKTLQ